MEQTRIQLRSKKQGKNGWCVGYQCCVLCLLPELSLQILNCVLGPQGLSMIIPFTDPFQINFHKVQNWQFSVFTEFSASFSIQPSGLSTIHSKFSYSFLGRIPMQDPVQCHQSDTPKNKGLNCAVLLKMTSYRMKFKFHHAAYITFHKLVTACPSRHCLC